MGRDAAAAADLAREAVRDGVDALVVVGGDGMVHIGLQAVAGTSVPFGIIPAGSGNDVARALGIPRGDAAEAVEVIAAGNTIEIDLGRSDGTFFAAIAALGFDALVNDRANGMSWPRGRLRYDVALVVELGLFRPIPYELETDSGTERLDAMLVSVANGPSCGGGMKFVPDARLDDGVLDLFVLHPISKPALVRLFPKVYSGRHVTHPAVEIRRVRSVRVGAPGVTAYADGERLGPLPRTFEAVPAALRVFAPPAG